MRRSILSLLSAGSGTFPWSLLANYLFCVDYPAVNSQPGTGSVDTLFTMRSPLQELCIFFHPPRFAGGDLGRW